MVDGGMQNPKTHSASRSIELPWGPWYSDQPPASCQVPVMIAKLGNPPSLVTVGNRASESDIQRPRDRTPKVGASQGQDRLEQKSYASSIPSCLAGPLTQQELPSTSPLPVPLPWAPIDINSILVESQHLPTLPSLCPVYAP
jgi:hypothetical protein